MDLKEVNEVITAYLRPGAYPVAVRMCASESEIPEKVRRPKRDLGIQVTVCQVLSMARRYGWAVAISGEDQQCPHGAVALGFVKPKPAYLDGSFATPTANREAVAKTLQAMPKLEFGKYRYMLAAPLHTASFEPQLIVIYANPAQVARLIQSSLHDRGGGLTSTTLGGYACSSIISQALLTDECQFVVAGAGDRYFALTQDHEMTFTMPVSKVEMTMKTLKESHDSGRWRYPTPSYLRFQAELPPRFYQIMDYLKQGE